MIETKIKSNSLYSRMLKAGVLDDFFGLVASEAPGYEEMRAWCEEHDIRASNGALHTLITHHMGAWRARKAIEAVREEELYIPADADEQIRERLRGMRLDLALRDLSERTAVALLKLDLQERELAHKNASLRETGVQALMDEARGNAAAEEALRAFLAALDAARSEGGDA